MIACSVAALLLPGGYDCVVRVWSIASETAEILQELEGHKSFINSLAFDFSRKHFLFSYKYLLCYVYSCFMLLSFTV